jgi:hypothetical protein
MLRHTELCCVSIPYGVTLGCSSHDDRQEQSSITPSPAPSDVSGRPSETGAAAAVVSADASSSSGASGTADAGSVPFNIDAGLGPTQVLAEPNVSFAWDASAAVDGTLNESSLLTAGSFDGELSGMLDRARSTISGTWNITWESLEVPGTCNGPFTVSLQP